MSAKKITYEDKVAVNPPGVRKNQVWDLDLNEIKEVAENHANLLDALSGLIPTLGTEAVDSVAGKTGVVTLDKNDIGLGNVDDTSDVNKPISTATQIIFDLKENLANKQNSLAVDGTGTKYPTVDAVNSVLPKNYAKVVYVNSTTPSTAAIFDDDNPPVVNNDVLKADVANLYIGTDASTWVWNGSTYDTKVVHASSNFFVEGTTVDAGSNKNVNIQRVGSIKTSQSITAQNMNSSSVTANVVTVNPETPNTIASFDVGKQIKSLPTDTYPSLTELSYVKGVTSEIQPQINGKQNTLVPGTNIKTLDGDSLLGSGNLLPKTELAYALADETANLTVSTRIKFRMPHAMTLSDVRISLNDSPTLSSVVVDVKENGVSIFSTLLSIDANEKTSVTAATPAVISDINLADDAEITVSTTQIGSGDTGKGLKILFKGRKA